MRKIILTQVVVAALLATGAMTAGADTAPTANALPDSAADGLQLVSKTDTREVWKKPGATFGQYDKVAILECPVAFTKDYQRNYNENVQDLTHMVTAKDMARIEQRLSDEFRAVFVDELQTKGGYQVVTYGGADVLVLRPAIINLDVAAPDLQTPDMSQNFTADAGSMTLYLELYDSVTSTLLARVVDAEGANSGLMQVANSVTNKMAADDILRRWADTLRKALDQARAAAPQPVPAAAPAAVPGAPAAPATAAPPAATN
jgi:hypothetical protein